MFEAVSFIDTLVPFLPALGSIISILLTIPALRWVETRGRRPLLLKTLVFCIAANVFLLIFTLVSQDGSGWASWGFAAAFFMYGIGYNLGIGPVAYFLPAELVPPEAASASLGAAVAVNWICTITTTLFYYPLSKSIGGWSYLIFIVPTYVLKHSSTNLSLSDLCSLWFYGDFSQRQNFITRFMNSKIEANYLFSFRSILWKYDCWQIWGRLLLRITEL